MSRRKWGILTNTSLGVTITEKADGESLWGDTTQGTRARAKKELFREAVGWQRECEK